MIVVLGRPALGRTADGLGPMATGRAGAIAVAAAAAGARVELVGSVGDDAAGDKVAVALGQARVGHAALLRDPSAATPTQSLPADDPAAAGSTEASVRGPVDASTAAPPSGGSGRASNSDASADARALRLPRLDAADVELGLRYLSECRVLVIADALSDDAAAAAAEAAAYHGAALVAVLLPGVAVPPAFIDVATVLEDDGAEGVDGVEDPEAAAFADLVAAFAVALDEGQEPRDAFAAAVRSAGWEPAAG